MSFIFLFASLRADRNMIRGAEEILTRTSTWVVDVFTGGINQDTTVFTILVALLFWYLGYNAIWHTFRIERLWRVVLPLALILVTNIIFYNGNAQLDIYLYVFIFMMLLLIARFNLDSREWDWYVSGIRVPRRLRQQFLWVGSGLALLALLIAWNIPSNDVQEQLDEFQEFLQSDPLTELGELWNRVLAPVEGEGPATTDYYGSDSLGLGGAIQLGDQIIMRIKAPNDGRRYYWRSRVFERYEQGRWSPSATLRVTDNLEPTSIIMNSEYIGGSRETIEQEFTMAIQSRLIYTAPQPSEIHEKSRIDFSSIDPLVNPEPMNVSVVRPTNVLSRGESYQATSLMSIATANELRSASENYPDWVLNPNVYAGRVSPKVIELTQEIINQSGAVTAYDKAKAIETWLRNNITYNETISPPPLDQDPLEWLLFEVREGYCTYYATAMIAMLRTQGIPARMAAGFAQGEWDASTQEFIVRERDAHTWVEVFIPGYGWIEFEPTAAQAPLNREGDNETETGFVDTPLEPTFTPSPTPSPVPSPTPQSGESAQQPSDQVQATITMTPTPTPTATPVIVPTVPPNVSTPPESPSFVSFLLSALGLLLMGLLFIVLLAVIFTFIWWWWEWRGMRGLSPVSRAYARLERYISLLGIQTDSKQTTLEKQRVFSERVPAAKRPIREITRMYTQERYGGIFEPTEQVHNQTAADKAWSRTRENILKRWFARFVPWMK